MTITSFFRIIAIITLVHPIINAIPLQLNQNVTEEEIYSVFTHLSFKTIEGSYYINKPSYESSLILNKLFYYFSKRSGSASLKFFLLKNKSVILQILIKEGIFRNNFFSITQSLNPKDINSTYNETTVTNNPSEEFLSIPLKLNKVYIKQFKSIFLRNGYNEDYVSINLNVLNRTQSVKASIAFDRKDTNQTTTEFTIELDLKIKNKEKDISSILFSLSFILMTLFHLFSNCYMIYLSKSKTISLHGISFIFIHIDMIWNTIQCIFISNLSSFLEFNTYGYGVVAGIYFLIFSFAQSYLVYLMKKFQDASCKQLIHLFTFEFIASLFIFLYSFYYSFLKYLVHFILPTTFIPQILHNISSRVKKREIPIVSIISFTLNKTFLLLSCLCLPSSPFQTKPELFPFLYVFGTNLVQILILFVQWTYGYDFYLPRHMKNSIERYCKTYQEALGYNPNLYTEKCPICLYDLIPTPGENNIEDKAGIKTKSHAKSSKIEYNEKIIEKEFSNVTYSNHLTELESKLETNPNVSSSPSEGGISSIRKDDECSISYDLNCKQDTINVNKPLCICIRHVWSDFARYLAKRKYLVLTPCNHFFHPNCIEEWWKSKKECPFCRHPLPVFDYGSEQLYIEDH